MWQPLEHSAYSGYAWAYEDWPHWLAQPLTRERSHTVHRRIARTRIVLLHNPSKILRVLYSIGRARSLRLSLTLRFRPLFFRTAAY